MSGLARHLGDRHLSYVKHLRDKDVFELKRAVSKIKKTCDALEGDIAGFENLIIVTPSFAKIFRGRGAAGNVERVEGKERQ